MTANADFHLMQRYCRARWLRAPGSRMARCRLHPVTGNRALAYHTDIQCDSRINPPFARPAVSAGHLGTGDLYTKIDCYTGRNCTKKSAQMASAISQSPTSINMRPPQILTRSVLARSLATRLSCARATANAKTNIKVDIVKAAVTNPRKASHGPPIVNACPARPARIGPVQPKPART